MKTLRFALTPILVFAFSAAPLCAAPVKIQDPQATAIMRGYRTGYSDGYQSGVSDLVSNGTREFRNKTEYEHGDRAYNASYGTIEEYRDGYQQGFEVGYNAGFDRKPFNSTFPSDLKRRGDESSVGYPKDQNKDPGNPNKSSSEPILTTQTTPTSQTNNIDAVPRDT